MSRQITVRLPDELVEFIDGAVDRGHAGSRAAAVAQAIEWERRREIAAQDAAILANSDQGAEFTELAEYAANTALDDLD